MKTYTTRSNARRALSKICIKCVDFAKEVIFENADGTFSFNEDKLEELMTVAEWQKQYGAAKGKEVEYSTPAMEVKQAVSEAVMKEAAKEEFHSVTEAPTIGLVPAAKVPHPHGNNAEALKTSLKLARQIVCVTEDSAVFKNAHQMWKANPSWMTSGQQDNLTKKLYEAAKRGEYITVTVNERDFRLVSVE